MQNLVKQTVAKSSNGGVATVAKESATDTQTQTVASIIYFISGVIEVALVFRFVLKITGANPGSNFVSWIYGFTQFLIMPFQGIFSSAATTGIEVRAVFEPATLVALFVYALAAWGIVKLIAIAAGQSNEEL